MDPKQRARQYLDIRCLGHTVYNYFEPDEFECDYPNVADFTCEDCICNFREFNGRMNPVNGKCIGQKVFKAMKAIVRDESKLPPKKVEPERPKTFRNKYELCDYLRAHPIDVLDFLKYEANDANQ